MFFEIFKYRDKFYVLFIYFYLRMCLEIKEGGER